MKNFSSAFTMIELVFVIVVLGILAGIAVPRLAATRDDATIAKMRGDVAAIRSGLSLKRSENLMKGDVSWPDINNTAAMFGNILQQPLYAGNNNNGWQIEGDDNLKYKACVAKECTIFTYYKTASADGKHPAGSFDCDHSKAVCQKLAQ